MRLKHTVLLRVSARSSTLYDSRFYTSQKMPLFVPDVSSFEIISLHSFKRQYFKCDVYLFMGPWLRPTMQFPVSEEVTAPLRVLVNGLFGYAVVKPRSSPKMKRPEVPICSYNFLLGALHLCKLGLTFHLSC